MKASRVRWFRRLDLRLALVLAALLLGFHYLSPYVYNMAAMVADVPRQALVLQDREWISGELLSGATEEAPGRWVPTPDAYDAFSEAFFDGVDGTAFLWLDREGLVVAKSELLPWAEGSVWPFAPTFFGKATLPGDEEPVRYWSLPVVHEEEEAGWLVSLCVDEVVHLAWHEAVGTDFDDLDPCDFLPDPDAPLMTAEAWAALEVRQARFFSILSVGIATATALFLGVGVSLLVTRRLTRLAGQAAAPLGEAGELPGPFNDRGADEVAFLARAMNSMRRQVRELIEGLALRDADRRRWIAQVSHDLRTPLTALMACLDRSELLLEETRDTPPDEERMRELITVARMDAERVRALADDLLDIARLDAGDELTLEPVPPGELVRTTLMGLRPMADTKGVELEADVAPALPILWADGRRLVRALENLLRNAIHFAQERVRVLVAVGDDGLRLEVQDDGVGLPEEDGEILLEKLSGRRSRDDSAGLGLKVTRRVAEAHGGRIGAYNLPGGGAAVWFVIPPGKEGESPMPA